MNTTNNEKNKMGILWLFISLNQLEHKIFFPQMTTDIEVNFYIHHVLYVSSNSILTNMNKH